MSNLNSYFAVDVYDTVNGWPIWIDLAEFCRRADVRPVVFTDGLDFGRLDE